MKKVNIKGTKEKAVSLGNDVKKKLLSNGKLSVNALFYVFILLNALAAMAVVYGVFMLLTGLGVVKADSVSQINTLLLFFILTSVFVLLLITVFSGKIPFSPLNRFINAMRRLAGGDYSIRLEENGLRLYRELNASFNMLADELDHTELLRSDFINNFSHEFKTPIMSIKGFAELLERDDISEEQRVEYARIISDEAGRLSSMATNVLNLTRLENQAIVTEIEQFNVSDQLRSAILMLDGKFEAKSIDVSADIDEYYINGDKNMIMQIWLNLLDNAIKYSPEGALVTVDAAMNTDILTVTIKNTGSFIPEEARDRIFTKFYQSDVSHSAKGNGLGLPIAKRIAVLHRGTITVSSDDTGTAFTVLLPAGNL